MYDDLLAVEWCENVLKMFVKFVRQMGKIRETKSDYSDGTRDERANAIFANTFMYTISVGAQCRRFVR